MRSLPEIPKKKSKRKEVILGSIFKIWIAIFGSTKNFLIDNGDEFNNTILNLLVFAKVPIYKDDSYRKPMVQWFGRTS